MVITTPEVEPPTTAEIAESILGALRQATAARYEAVADAITEALVVLLHECGWPRGMAREAINHAMVNHTTMKAALFANQTG
ncbi:MULTISPECIES: hypothetical protein [unclassified Nonomuraea]|uniref:hypothetical protein n=1 Tax=unclassified Nonomuraea TaxID=2593643 RepID=UPI0033EAB3B1